MAADFYTRMQATATRVTTKYAQGTLLLRRSTPGTGPAYNPGAPTIVDYPLSGVARVTDQIKDGALVDISDSVLTVQVPSVTPTIADAAVVDGLQREIVKIERIPAAGTVVAYKIYLKA